MDLNITGPSDAQATSTYSALIAISSISLKVCYSFTNNSPTTVHLRGAFFGFTDSLVYAN